MFVVSRFQYWPKYVAGKVFLSSLIDSMATVLYLNDIVVDFLENIFSEQKMKEEESLSGYNLPITASTDIESYQDEFIHKLDFPDSELAENPSKCLQNKSLYRIKIPDLYVGYKWGDFARDLLALEPPVIPLALYTLRYTRTQSISNLTETVNSERSVNISGFDAPPSNSKKENQNDVSEVSELDRASKKHSESSQSIESKFEGRVPIKSMGFQGFSNTSIGYSSKKKEKENPEDFDQKPLDNSPIIPNASKANNISNLKNSESGLFLNESVIKLPENIMDDKSKSADNDDDPFGTKSKAYSKQTAADSEEIRNKSLLDLGLVVTNPLPTTIIHRKDEVIILGNIIDHNYLRKRSQRKSLFSLNPKMKNTNFIDFLVKDKSRFVVFGQREMSEQQAKKKKNEFMGLCLENIKSRVDSFIEYKIRIQKKKEMIHKLEHQISKMRMKCEGNGGTKGSIDYIEKSARPPQKKPETIPMTVLKEEEQEDDEMGSSKMKEKRSFTFRRIPHESNEPIQSDDGSPANGNESLMKDQDESFEDDDDDEASISSVSASSESKKELLKNLHPDLVNALQIGKNSENII